MMISLCTELFDWEGYLPLHIHPSDSDLSAYARRVSRTATLDGGVIVIDNGYTPSDATFNIVLRRISREQYLQLQRVAVRHSSFYLSVDGKLFAGVIEQIKETTNITLKFLVTRQLAG